MISFGQKGENSLSEGGRKRILSGLEDDLVATNPRDFARLLFKGTISVNGESTAYIDAIVDGEIGSIADWEASEGNKDGVISDQEKIDYGLAIEGTKETIKDAIKRQVQWWDKQTSDGGRPIEEGWHTMYQRDGVWYFEDFTEGDKVITPIYINNEAAKDNYQIEY